MFTPTILAAMRLTPSIPVTAETLDSFVEAYTTYEHTVEIRSNRTKMFILYQRNSVFGSRRLFRTLDNYLGLCPVSTETDDQVWLLENATVPFILRPTPELGVYRLIGECYVHGIMQGELLQNEAAPLEFNKIALR